MVKTTTIPPHFKQFRGLVEKMSDLRNPLGV